MHVGSLRRARSAALIVLCSTFVSAATAISAPVPARTGDADGMWVQIPPPTLAPATDGGAACWDPVRGRMLLFGGRDGFTYRNDVWALTPGAVNRWERLSPAGTPPPARFAHTMVYDSARDRMIVYGGSSNGTLALGDAWELRLSDPPTWSPIAASNPPPARMATVAAYDPVGDRMIVYGGASGSTVFGDTWQLSLAGATPSWSQLQFTDPDPGPRQWSAGAYDPIAHRMLICGGDVGGSSGRSVFIADTWALSLDGTPAWSPIDVGAVQPHGRRGHAAAFDAVHDALMIFGGWDGNNWRSDAAVLNFAPGPQWYFAPPLTESPSGCERATLVFDPIHAQGVVYGGALSGKAIDRGWSLVFNPGPWWAHLEPAPSPRNGNVAVYDPARGQLVEFGGNAEFGSPAQFNVIPDQDTWSLPLDGTASWHILGAPGTALPVPRTGPILVRDPAHDRLFIFGGGDPTGAFHNDVWTFDLASGVWSQVSVAGTPPAERWFSGAAFDPARSRFFVFAGEGTGQLFGDLWELDLEPTPQWTHVVPAGVQPIARFSPALLYDPVRDRMLMFGGVAVDGTFLRDTWTLSLGAAPAWAQLAVQGSGPGAAGTTTVYDSARDRLVVFGGDAARSNNLVFALSLSGGPPTWTQLAPAGTPPPPRSYGVGVYDPVNDRMVVAQGQGDSGFVPEGDAWMLEFTEPSTPTRLSFADAQAGAGTVRLTWFTPDGAGQQAIAQRSADGATWDDVARLTSDAAGEFVLVDRVPAGGRFEYRLGVAAPGGEQFTDGHWVVIPVGVAFGLTSVGPNPSRGDIAVTFAVTSAAPAALDLFDVAGRRVLHRDVTALGAGAHTLDLAKTGQLTSGVYVLRLVQGARAAERKIAVVR